ncbi:hypothetical protein D3876_03665 [Sphingomonas cavernae]|uniref:Uncharacterized protein n=2 Tax=Sphingomonas cavernae TaxID=2320861 RepID=A0A418WQB7_9SPHN|nr:hypothetical protein D3876_03665 [Sphingomonas cavernae]
MAESGDRETVVAIVEVVLSPDEIASIEAAGEGSLARRLVTALPKDVSGPEFTIEALAGQVAKITGDQPQRLTSAALSVRADGAQLATIAALPGVLAIYAN